jgi:hypothetical protein
VSLRPKVGFQFVRQGRFWKSSGCMVGENGRVVEDERIVELILSGDGGIEEGLRLVDDLYRDSGNFSLRNIGNSAFLFQVADRLQCIEKLFEFFSLNFCCKDN